MTVDFPLSYPASVTPAGKPLDVQTLQETFAALLRSYGTEKGGSQTETLLEILRPAPSDETKEHDRHQQSTERNDFTQTDRKLLDKSEIQNNALNSDYRNRLDQRAIIQNDYHEKSERSEPRQSTSRADAFPLTTSAAPSPDAVRPHDTVPKEYHAPPQQNNVPQITGTNNQSPLTNTTASSGVPDSGQVNVGIPMNMNAPASIPAPVAPQAGSSPTFTVFTPSGRLGQPQEKSDEKENEDEEAVEEKTGKKKQPFAVFEAVRTETARPVHRDHSRQGKESVSQSAIQQAAGKPPNKPKEVEPEQFRSIKTIADLLEVPVQNVAPQKKGEPNQPNPMQYLHRIAAACEAASQYAPIRMKINLDHLGTLTLRFFYKADKLALHFETPSKESALFVRGHLDGLRTLLAARNTKITDIEII